MNTTLKNATMFIGITALLVISYFVFIKKPKDEGNLVSSNLNTSNTTPTDNANGAPLVADDFLNILLSVQSLELDDGIFADNVFLNLRDSSITLIPTGDEGRPNPFAPVSSGATVPKTPAR